MWYNTIYIFFLFYVLIVLCSQVKFVLVLKTLLDSLKQNTFNSCHFLFWPICPVFCYWLSALFSTFFSLSVLFYFFLVREAVMAHPCHCQQNIYGFSAWSSMPYFSAAVKKFGILWRRVIAICQPIDKGRALKSLKFIVLIF